MIICIDSSDDDTAAPAPRASVGVGAGVEINDDEGDDVIMGQTAPVVDRIAQRAQIHEACGMVEDLVDEDEDRATAAEPGGCLDACKAPRRNAFFIPLLALEWEPFARKPVTGHRNYAS